MGRNKQLARHAVHTMPDKVLSGADGVMKALEDIARKMGGGEVAVGFMEGATYPDGTPVAAVAFWNEFGKGVQSEEVAAQYDAPYWVCRNQAPEPGVAATSSKEADTDPSLACETRPTGRGMPSALRRPPR